MRKTELLIPAGSLDVLKTAVIYGADAVYLGGEAFGLRAKAKNFTNEEIMEGIKFAHDHGVKVYITANILAHNDDLAGVEEYFEELKTIRPDALIISDPGVFTIAKRVLPDMEIHISTQANNTNYGTYLFWHELGAKRVVLARELSLEEIAEIRAKTPKDLEIECFVHGAMCVSFSGRCLLSQYLVNRDANRGECAQPCRWGYHLMEEKSTNEFYPVFEDEKGTYILNAKDMCMLNHIDKLAEAGVNSFKIEGRAKSSYYVSVITNAYRKAMDIYKSDPEHFELPQWLKDEVFKVSHRAYCTGFFFGHPKESQYYENGGYIREYDVVAVVDGCSGGRIYCTQKNKFNKGDDIEVLSPVGSPVKFTVEEMFDEYDNSIDTANHAAMKMSIRSDLTFPEHSIIRMKK